MTIILKPGSVPLETLETIYRDAVPVRIDPHFMPLSKRRRRALPKSQPVTNRFTASIPASANSPRSALLRAMSPRFSAT